MPSLLAVIFHFNQYQVLCMSMVGMHLQALLPFIGFKRCLISTLIAGHRAGKRCRDVCLTSDRSRHSLICVVLEEGKGKEEDEVKVREKGHGDGEV